MFRKKIINASSNLKRSLYLGTNIKSNGWLYIRTEGVSQTGISFLLDLYSESCLDNIWINKCNLHLISDILRDLNYIIWKSKKNGLDYNTNGSIFVKLECTEKVRKDINKIMMTEVNNASNIQNGPKKQIVFFI
jgi:hypothetical protein